MNLQSICKCGHERVKHTHIYSKDNALITLIEHGGFCVAKLDYGWCDCMEFEEK